MGMFGLDVKKLSKKSTTTELLRAYETATTKMYQADQRDDDAGYIVGEKQYLRCKYALIEQVTETIKKDKKNTR